MDLQEVINNLKSLELNLIFNNDLDADKYAHQIEQLKEIDKYMLDLRAYTDIDLLFTFAMMTAKSELGLVSGIENQIILEKIPEAVNKIFANIVEGAKQHIKNQIVVNKNSVVMPEMSDSIN